MSKFDGASFSWEPQAGSLILRINGFASFRIVGFHPFEVAIEDITINMNHAKFFSKATL
jgi:hypothetical protein